MPTSARDTARNSFGLAAVATLLFCALVPCPAQAAINPDIVKGSYFFVQHARSLGLGVQFPPTQGFGAVTFRDTDFTFRVQANNGRTSSGSGSYQIKEDSRIWAGSQSNAFFGIANGLVAFDGSLIAGGQSGEAGQSDNAVFFFAIRGPSGAVGTSDLRGTYSFVQTATSSNGDALSYFVSLGKMTFDGAGNISFTHSVSDMARRSENSGVATYTLDPGGSGTLSAGTARLAIGLSADKNVFIASTINNPSSVSMLIGVRDAPGVVPAATRFFGSYALLRLGPDFSPEDLTTDGPYFGLGDITSDGVASTDGEILERFPYPIGEIYGLPFSRTYTVSTSGRVEIRARDSGKVLTGYLTGSSGDSFVGAVLNSPTDHGIGIAFRTGPFIGNSAVVDAAEYRVPVAPGSIVSIFGVGL
ncbi:MAG: hypothetical protein AAB403_03340, partial [Planctomycetota bacterium]